MASPSLLQDRFEAGVKRDVARDDLPRGALWWSEDMLPNVGAALRERGGYAYSSSNIASSLSTASYVIAGIHAQFVAGTKNLTVDEDGELYNFNSAGSVTDIGAAVVTLQNPVFHRDKVIIPASSGTAVPKVYAGSGSVADMAGSPPNGKYATVFNDRTLLAASSASGNRLWFSAAGDPESWDTTNGYWDFTYPVAGLATLRTAILVFHAEYVSRLRGSTPPPGSDFFADDPLWNVGCADARSIVYWKDKIIFASADGIHVTDGAGYDDLTAQVGMRSYWQDTLAAYDSSTWTIVGGVHRDHYFVVVMDGSTFKTAAMIDLRRLAWWPVTNVDARSMWSAQGVADELYFGRRGAARVGSLSSVFSPSSSVKNDGDGTAVTGLVETPFYRGKGVAKTWRRLFVTHHLEDYASDNPTVSVGQIRTPEDTSYTTLSDSLAETSAESKKRVGLRFAASQGVAFSLTRANAGDWRLDALSVDAHSREGSR